MILVFQYSVTKRQVSNKPNAIYVHEYKFGFFTLVGDCIGCLLDLTQFCVGFFDFLYFKCYLSEMFVQPQNDKKLCALHYG